MTGPREAVARLQELLARLEMTQAELEKAEDSETAVAILGELAELAREVQSEIDRARRDASDALP